MIRALITRSNEIHGYNTRHAVKGNYLRKVVKLENFKPFFLKVVAAVYDLQEVVEIGGLTALFDWTRKGRGYKGFFYLTIQERSLN